MMMFKADVRDDDVYDYIRCKARRVIMFIATGG